MGMKMMKIKFKKKRYRLIRKNNRYLAQYKFGWLDSWKYFEEDGVPFSWNGDVSGFIRASNFLTDQYIRDAKIAKSMDNKIHVVESYSQKVVVD